MTELPDYNQRLFEKGFRSKIHLARFHWLKHSLSNFSKNKPLLILELGCYDGRSIDWLPMPPSLYDGFDANWEGGLDLGRERFQGVKEIHFHQCSTPVQMIPDEGGYDIGISLETFEHVPPEMVEEYLEVFANSVKSEVYFSVPNEIGVPFLLKFIVKKVIYRDSADEPYLFSEVVAAILGQSSKVHRNEHKGFDYRNFVQLVKRRFDIVSVSGIPFAWLPASLSFTIGIVAKPKQS